MRPVELEGRTPFAHHHSEHSRPIVLTAFLGSFRAPHHRHSERSRGISPFASRLSISVRCFASLEMTQGMGA
jgi:hypothetical protein